MSCACEGLGMSCAAQVGDGEDGAGTDSGNRTEEQGCPRDAPWY